MLDAALKNPVGTNQHTEGVDNVNNHRPTGNSIEAALRAWSAGDAAQRMIP
jgi:hypothetical protein